MIDHSGNATFVSYYSSGDCWGI